MLRPPRSLAGSQWPRRTPLVHVSAQQLVTTMVILNYWGCFYEMKLEEDDNENSATKIVVINGTSIDFLQETKE